MSDFGIKVGKMKLGSVSSSAGRRLCRFNIKCLVEFTIEIVWAWFSGGTLFLQSVMVVCIFKEFACFMNMDL